MERSPNSELRKFVAPEYIFGIGSRKLAGPYARKLGGERILVVSDPGVVAAGWTGEVVASLNEAGLSTDLFLDVSPNPRDHQVMAGARRYREIEANAIVAVGGGSPLDCAKGIGIVATNGGHILDYEGVDQVRRPMPPLICIPTTGGTSADVSQFAIITDTTRKTKIAIVTKAVVPDLALIDPLTLTTMDPYLTACTGMDALTHAIEAFVSNASSPMTDLHALEAIRLVGRHLVDSTRQPGNLELRSQIMQASLQAGLAFSNAILGAVHAMAHSLGGRLDLPHGECNSILLDHVISFNLPAASDRFDRVADAFGLDLRGMPRSTREQRLLEHIRGLKQEVGIIRSLREIGVTPADIPLLSENAVLDPCLLTNPRSAVRRDIELIYEEAL